MKISAKTKDCRLLVRVKGSFRESFDERALDTFARTYLRGFLKPKLVKKNLIEYSGPVGVSLYERLKSPISKRDFLFIMEQIVVAVEKINNNRLALDRLLMDIRYCFINDVTKEIQFLYIPILYTSIEKTLGSHDVTAFMESIIYSVTPASEKDTEYVSRFVYFLKSLRSFDPKKLEAFIAKEDRSVVNAIKKQNAGPSGFMTSKQKSYYNHYDHVGQDPDAEGTALLPEEATGLLRQISPAGDEGATTLLIEDEDEPTTALLEEEGTGLLDENGTALLDETSDKRFPTLYRTLTEETISVYKPVFRLGKERSYVDYFVTNNNAVSRSHADIITRGDRYFVIDLNSRNHTYINGQALVAQCETELRDGDCLKLGNEEFVFHTAGAAGVEMACPNCGAHIIGGSCYCAYCGCKLY